MTNQLTKAEAAAYLDCSTRTLERAAAKHSIQTTTRRNGSGRPEVVYNLSDLDLLKSDRETPVYSPAVEAPPGMSVKASGMVRGLPAVMPKPNWEQAQKDALSLLFSPKAMLDFNNGYRPPVLAERLTLSLSEAVEYTGLTQNAINNAATRGKLKATHTRPRRYRPADLRTFVESL